MAPNPKSLVRGRYVLLRTRDAHTVETLVDGAVLVEGGRIVEIGRFAELAPRHPDAAMIGAETDLVMPGMVDAHHHIGMTPVQLGSPDLPLELWLTHQWRARSVDPWLDTLVSGFEHLASGVTAVQHLGRMRPAPVSDWPDEAHRVIGAYRDLGLRVSYAFCTRDQHRLVYGDDDGFLATLPPDLAGRTGAILRRTHFELADFESEYLRPMLEHLEHGRDPLVRLWLAPINLERASDRMLGFTAEMARKYDLGIHLHLSETPYQKEFSRRRFGKSSIAHLEEIGFLGPHLTVGHGTWLSEADLDIVHAHGVCICHNASSNLRLRSGIAPLAAFIARGIPVALGIDEAGINDDRDMLQEMRLVKMLHCAPGLEDSPVTPARIFQMATENGAKAIGFGDEIGIIAPGRRADLVVVDFARIAEPYLSPAIAPVDALVHRAKQTDVRVTMVEGRVVYSDGVFAGVDRVEIMARLREELARDLRADEIERSALSEALLPHIKAFYDGWTLPEGEPWYRLNART
jgi:5-methylthioadenosine/S-adenosylhomocysteine deaminase